MTNKERLKLIEKNIYESEIKYNEGLITREYLDNLKFESKKRIKELKALIRDNKDF